MSLRKSDSQDPTVSPLTVTNRMHVEVRLILQRVLCVTTTSQVQRMLVVETSGPRESRRSAVVDGDQHTLLLRQSFSQPHSARLGIGWCCSFGVWAQRGADCI
jgi:hypothetical protein